MEEIAALLAGFERFRAKYYAHGTAPSSLGAQKPAALVVSCCDSRVDPAMLMGAGPGELFVIRNVANLVPPYSYGTKAPGVRAAIEFAVRGLDVQHIIVLGHSNCGGISALLNRNSQQGQFEFVEAWVSVADEVRRQIETEMASSPVAEQLRACEKESIRMSLANLMTFPWIAERVHQSTVILHGWYFDLETGGLEIYDSHSGYFR